MTITERDDLIKALQKAKEIDSDQYDASYQLMREIIQAYADMPNLSECDYLDLNAVYHMCIETQKQGIASKKTHVDATHLLEAKKEYLKDLLSDCWNKAQKKEYINHDPSQNCIHMGMFGTGFFSFENKTDIVSVRQFIQMCIDIRKMTDDKDIFTRCEKILNRDIPGMTSASVSMVLHCLMPCTFPVLNGDHPGSIFIELNKLDEMDIHLVKPIKDLSTYIENCRRIKRFRDENFDFKHYRYFDIAVEALKHHKSPANKINEISDQIK